MPRTVKTIKDDEGNDLEIYLENCSICNQQLISPKDFTDEMEVLFPFVAEKNAKGAQCKECALEQERNGNILFTKEQYLEIQKVLSEKLANAFKDR